LGAVVTRSAHATQALLSARAQVRNAIDLARMGSAIRVFEEKMSPSSNGMVSEDERRPPWL
jgi:hypothetical protein